MALPSPDFINKRIIKAFQHIPFKEIPEAPVEALRGVGKQAVDLLYKSFHVKTVRDLADLKYILWAQELLALERVPQEKIDMHSFENKLIKKYEATPVKTLITSPVYVLQGLSEADAKRMQKAFHVKNIRDLARLKYARFAQEICSEAYAALSSPSQPGALTESESLMQSTKSPATDTPKKSNRWMRYLLLALLVILILLLVYIFGRGCLEKQNGHNQTSPDSNTATDTQGSENSQPDTTAQNSNLSTSEINSDSPTSDSVQNSKPVPDTNANSIKAGSSYTILKDDTLYDLSRRAYGNDQHWIRIYKANRQLISNPHKIKEGQVIQIPAE